MRTSPRAKYKTFPQGALSKHKLDETMLGVHDAAHLGLDLHSQTARCRPLFAWTCAQACVRVIDKAYRLRGGVRIDPLYSVCA